MNLDLKTRFGCLKFQRNERKALSLCLLNQSATVCKTNNVKGDMLGALQ